MYGMYGSPLKNQEYVVLDCGSYVTRLADARVLKRLERAYGDAGFDLVTIACGETIVYEAHEGGARKVVDRIRAFYDDTPRRRASRGLIVVRRRHAAVGDGYTRGIVVDIVRAIGVVSSDSPFRFCAMLTAANIHQTHADRNMVFVAIDTESG